jgi:hypothetical protein
MGYALLHPSYASCLTRKTTTTSEDFCRTSLEPGPGQIAYFHLAGFQVHIGPEQ